jgi:hypothetical protein
VAVVSSYRYRVHFEDDRDAMANYVGDVLQVGGDITFEGRPGVITDAKAEGATRIYYPHATRRPAHRCPYVAPPPSRFAGSATRAWDKHQALAHFGAPIRKPATESAPAL